MNNQENNKLIAEFLGYKLKPCNNDKYYKFNSSWDWLMPVVKKIKDSNYTSVKMISPINNSVINPHIEDAYKAVIQFIKWHNENK